MTRGSGFRFHPAPPAPKPKHIRDPWIRTYIRRQEMKLIYCLVGVFVALAGIGTWVVFSWQS